MRSALLVALFAFVAVSSDAAAQTPVVVGARGFTVEELRAANPGAPRSRMATALILGEWDVREAQARGIVVPEAAVDIAMAEASRQESQLAGLFDPTPPEQLRAEVAAGIRRELIIDAITLGAGPGSHAFGRAFDAAAARHRAVTFCRPAYADPLWNLCARRTGACSVVGLPYICADSVARPRNWYVYSNVVTDFFDPPKAFDDPDPRRSFNRLRAYLRSHSPRAHRRCFWEEDDADLSFICPSRADAIAVAYAITRVHQEAKKHWTIPATAGRI